MTEDRHGGRGMAVPLLISTAMHGALLAALSNPDCFGVTAAQGQVDEDQQRTMQSRQDDPHPPALTVDISGDVIKLPRKACRSEDAPCSPDAIPEYYHVDIAPGAMAHRIREVTRQSRYGLMIATEFAQGKVSRGLHGWFRPFDAARLLAGDAGLCAVDWGDTIGVHPCYRSDTPFDRTNEPKVRRERKPPDCTAPKFSPSPAPLQETRIA